MLLVFYKNTDHPVDYMWEYPVCRPQRNKIRRQEQQRGKARIPAKHGYARTQQLKQDKGRSKVEHSAQIAKVLFHLIARRCFLRSECPMMTNMRATAQNTADDNYQYKTYIHRPHPSCFDDILSYSDAFFKKILIYPLTNSVYYDRLTLQSIAVDQPHIQRTR